MNTKLKMVVKTYMKPVFFLPLGAILLESFGVGNSAEHVDDSVRQLSILGPVAESFHLETDEIFRLYHIYIYIYITYRL